MKYCTKCGKLIHDEAVICVGCGAPVEDAYGKSFLYNSPNTASSPENLVNTLSVRYNTYGIIWIVIAIIQIVSVTCIPVGLWNLYAAYTNIKYGKAIQRNPTNIVKAHTPVTGAVVCLIINLLLGGVIGVAGSIYYFVAIRGFVMENQSAFNAIEQNQS